MQPEVQAALYAYLNGHISAPVYDKVPETASTPYVSIGEDSFEPDDTDESLGGEVFIELEIWSTYEGKKEAKTIARQIKQRLHRSYLNVEGFSFAAAHWESSDTFAEPDGETTRAVETYRILIHE